MGSHSPHSVGVAIVMQLEKIVTHFLLVVRVYSSSHVPQVSALPSALEQILQLSIHFVHVEASLR